MVFERKAVYTREDESVLIEAGKSWNFDDFVNPGSLHDLHPYPARFIPRIPRRAIDVWSKRGDLVYDPFCGCGTTLLESGLMGRQSIGTDNNDVAILVSRAKTQFYSSNDITTIREFATHFPKRVTAAKLDAEDLLSDSNFPGWFAPEVLEQLGLIRQFIEETAEPSKTFLLAVLSAIVVRVSLQDSDTRYARIAKSVSRHDVNRAFAQKLGSMSTALEEIDMATRIPSEIRRADSRDVPEIESQSINLIVSSPPYLNAFDYHKYHRQRLHLIRGDISFARKREIGGHDEFTKKNATPDSYFEDMASCLREWKRVLAPGGRCFLLVGDAIVNKAPVHVADELVDIATSLGMVLEERWIRSVKGTRRSFNVKNSRMTHEHGLVLINP
jgi:DNA modification methylase